MTDKLTLAVNHALNDARMARARMGLMAPTMGLDNKRHSAWCEYGFPEQVTYENLYALYRRGGIAHGAVEKLVGKCWQTNPEIIEGDDADESENETAWEKKAKQVFTNRFWRSFSEADRRRLVGRYAGILLHVRDEKDWNLPVTKGRGLAEGFRGVGRIANGERVGHWPELEDLRSAEDVAVRRTVAEWFKSPRQYPPRSRFHPW
jgi:hypothetical protein